MSAEFDALVAQAKANEDAEDAAVTLIQSIAASLAANPTPAQVAQLAADLKTHADALGAAIVAGTPAAPPA